MKAISIKLPEDMLSSVMQQAVQKSVSQSDIIRNALAAYLASSQAQPTSAAAQASRWAGMTQGPADLSTNPKHMKGFGQ